MSKADILEELPKLGQGDRREILERIWEMEEADLLKGAPPPAPADKPGANPSPSPP